MMTVVSQQQTIFESMGSIVQSKSQTFSLSTTSIESLHEDYYLSQNQILVHKNTNLSCTIHCIVALSKQQSARVEKNIEKYRNCSCTSVSKLKQHYSSQEDGYCTNQNKYYLIFQGHHSPNIKEQYLSRRHQGQQFEDIEIQAILCAMLCGMRQYSEYFGRKQLSVDLESVLIEINSVNGLRVKDPWLCDKNDRNSPTPINFFAKYPSPQKIDASNNQTFKLFDDFSSELFSIGVYGLQLLIMNFPDDIYAPKKYIDFKKISDYLKKIRNPKLRIGLSFLLSDNIFQRNKIYQLWNINCVNKYCLRRSISSYYLTPLQQKSQHPHSSHMNLQQFNQRAQNTVVPRYKSEQDFMKSQRKLNTNYSSQKKYDQGKKRELSNQKPQYLQGSSVKKSLNLNSTHNLQYPLYIHNSLTNQSGEVKMNGTNMKQKDFNEGKIFLNKNSFHENHLLNKPNYSMKSHEFNQFHQKPIWKNQIKDEHHKPMVQNAQFFQRNLIYDHTPHSDYHQNQRRLHPIRTLSQK